MSTAFQPYCVYCDNGVRLLFFAASLEDANEQAGIFMDSSNFEAEVCIERTELLVPASNRQR